MQEPTERTNVYDAVLEAKPQAVIVYCSDPRFQTAFDLFIEKELGLAKGQFIPFVVGGGAGVLAHPEKLPKEFKFMRDRLELFRKHYPTIRRVVLINHEDCKYYMMLTERILGFFKEHSASLAGQPREDMELIARIFNRFLSHLGMTVELYYAKFADSEHSKIAFERVSI